MISFGQNLYLWRIFKGLTQQSLAGKAGIPRPNLSAIESGRREVSLPTLRALAAALGLEPGMLVNGVAPLNFKGLRFPRESLERIAKISLGGIIKGPCDPRERDIAIMLSGIIRNRVNAGKKVYRKTLKERKGYIANWLMLKAAVEPQALNNLLARLDKYGSKANR